MASPKLRDAIRGQIGTPGSGPNAAASIAIIDWSSAYHAGQLLSGELSEDSFIALGDLTTVVTAAIMYDDVVIMGDPPAGVELLGLGQHLKQLRPATIVDDAAPLPTDTTDPTAVWGSLRHILDLIWRQTWSVFDRGKSAPWMQYLRDRWAELLPEAPFPEHNLSTNDHLGLNYSYSPLRPVPVVFEVGNYTTGSWQMRPSDSLAELILDNDLRALFYEGVAKQLQGTLAASGSDVTVRYLGGCLRSPMLLTRAHSSLNRWRTTEAWLESLWVQLARPRFPVVLPFWMNVVLKRADRPAQIGDIVADLRKTVQPLRRHRSELERELREGNEEVMSALAGALAQDARKTSEAAAIGADAVIAGVETAIQFVPGSVGLPSGFVPDMVGGPINRVFLRMFKPELWSVYTVSKQARLGHHSLAMAADLFDWPDLDSGIGATFMDRVGKLAWLA